MFRKMMTTSLLLLLAWTHHDGFAFAEAAPCSMGSLRQLEGIQCAMADDMTCFSDQEECDESGEWVENFECVGADEEVTPAWQSSIEFCLVQERALTQVAMQSVKEPVLAFESQAGKVQ